MASYSDGDDHVDRVLAQWARQQPELDTRPAAVVARLGRAVSLLDRGLDDFFAGYCLDRRMWDVLASLRRTGPPYRLTPTDLYRELMRTSGAITHRLNHLQQAGLVNRRADPNDGRSLLVELTPKGRKLVDEIAPLHLANERTLLSALTTAECTALADLLRRLLIALEPGVADDTPS